VFWGHFKKKLVELIKKKQKVHQAHATSAKNWQELARRNPTSSCL
jgi:hypothetical protein